MVELYNFFYNERLDLPETLDIGIMKSNFSIRNGLQNISKYNVNNYILNCKKQLREALNIPKVLKGLRTSIAYLDGITDINVIKTLPRYERLIRLEKAYDRVMCFGLS